MLSKFFFKNRRLIKILIFLLLLSAWIFFYQTNLLKTRIKNSIELSYQWFSNNINPKTGRLQYWYYPLTDTYSKSNSSIRQMIAVWSIAKAQKFLKTNRLDNLIRKTIDYYLSRYENGLNYNACIILILSEFDYPDKEKIIKQHADHILGYQQKNGSYLVFINNKDVESKEKGGIVSGEVMLALMNAYLMTKDNRYLESVQKGFEFYRRYWREIDRYYYIHWQTQAYYQLYLVTKNPEIANFIFEMNDELIENHINKETLTINNIVIMEGTADAYKLAKLLGDKNHEKKYKQTIDQVIKETLTLQVNKNQAKEFKNPERTVGGFFYSPEQKNQLIDFTFHPMNAMMKAYSFYNH